MKPGSGVVKSASGHIIGGSAWQFLNNKGKWVDYSDDVNAELSKRANESSGPFLYSAPNGRQYSICLATMKQTTQSSGTKRKIRLKPFNSNSNSHSKKSKSRKKPASKIRAGATPWESLAGDCSSLEGLQRLFEARQADSKNWGKLKFVAASKVENNALLKRFKPGKQCSLLFHGTDEAKVANISIEGLQMSFGTNGNLGVGLYGAPNPCKAYTYTSGDHGRYIFLCAYNLDQAKSGSFGFSSGKFLEYCVPSDHHVVVLWMIKVEKVE